jgi:hypothetical protein
MLRGPGSIIVAKEGHQRDKEKSKDKNNQNIFEYSFLPGSLENCHGLPPSACLGSEDISLISWDAEVSVLVSPSANCARSFSQCLPNAQDQPMDGPFS